MPLRDGVRLATDIYLPDNHGKYPVIVIRSPYKGTSSRSEDAISFCKQGLGMVIQDCRGTGNSEGEADLWRQEKEDGEDFLNWISTQDWFNGNLVTNGESYPGGIQWQAARCAHPAMKGLTPHFAPTNIYHSGYFIGGAFSMGIGMVWALTMRADRLGKKMTLNRNVCSLVPLKDAVSLSGIAPSWPLWDTWMKHPSYDDFWKQSDAESDFDRMTAPAFITGGWFDIFLPQTLSSFRKLRSLGASEEARNFTRCVIEPLNHDGQTGEVDYGICRAGIITTRNRFMKNILTSPHTDPLPDQPILKLFIMGSNRWLESDSWPLHGVRNTKFYLHSGGQANSASGDGSLDRISPQSAELPDSFVYDPADPVPTCGGNNLGFFPSGQREQGAVEARDDVLVYTSAPLEQDQDVIGEVHAVLYASSSAKDTDFTVKLVDVDPDGRAYNVCDGILRARYRNSIEREEFLVPGEVAEFRISCWATGITFLKGHAIRVQVSSSNFPRFERNSNSGRSFSEEHHFHRASQKIFHTEEFPSHVILPIYHAAQK